MFQHTAARRRLVLVFLPLVLLCLFQHTAARRRLVREAGQPVSGSPFQHTAARRRLAAEPEVLAKGRASFNTQPPEGGCHLLYWIFATSFVSTHSRPKAAAAVDAAKHAVRVFQHTAARRRLPGRGCWRAWVGSFNTQPPEGGCFVPGFGLPKYTVFQHTAARRRLRMASILHW